LGILTHFDGSLKQGLSTGNVSLTQFNCIMHPSDDSTCNSIVVGAHILRLDMLNIALDEWKTLVVLVIVILRAHTFEICHHVPKIGVWF
jgi:hypothetical protein